MHGFPGMVPHLGQVVDLGVAVVAGGDGITGTGGQDLVGLEFAVFAPFVGVSVLQEPAAAAAAEIVGSVGLHVDEILFADHCPDYESQVFGHRIAEGLAHQLARVLAGEFDLALPVPFGTGFQFALPDPFCIEPNNAFNLEVGFDPEFLQSEPDREEFVTSLRIEPHLAAQVLHRLDFGADDFLPVFIVG